MKKQLYLKIIITFFSIALLSVSAVAAPIKLRYANFPPAPTFPCVQMERWADEVKKRTDGKVIVDTFPGGTLLQSRNMFDGVLKGVADIGSSCPAYEPGRFPLLSGIGLPVGFLNCEVSSRVFWRLTQEFKPKEIADFKIITMFTSAPSYITTKDPVRSIEDLKGMPIRVTGDTLEIVKVLEASPISMPMTDLPEALQKGVVKGYAASREVLMDMKFAEMVKYVTDYPLATVSFAVVMNKEKWNSLSSDVQKVIDDLSEEQAIWTGKYMDNHVVKSLNWAQKEHGLKMISLTPAEKAKWGQRHKPIVDKWVQDTEAKGLPGKAFLKRLYELKAEYSK